MKSHLPPILAALLLMLMAVLAGGAARRESVTIDEVTHIAAGVSYVEKLDLRLNQEHPPLAKIISAVPLAITGAHADYRSVPWVFSGSGKFPFMQQYLGQWVFGHWFLMSWNDPVSILALARLPMLLLTLLLGYVLYLLGSRLGNRFGGLLALAVFVTMPAFLAFGPLVITDIAVALFWVLTTWQLPRMWQAPSQSEVIKFGLALAGALLSKFSAGLLLFVILAFALSLRILPISEQPRDKSELRGWRRRGWRNVGKGILWAALFVYVFYFVFSWNQPTNSFDIIPHFPASPVLRRLLMPAWLYLQGVLGFVITVGSRPTFILGHIYPHGVWFYFPVLFLLKSQLAFLGLLLLACVFAAVPRLHRARPAVPEGMALQFRSVWISLIVFVAACMLSRLDISIRHFTIALALVALLLAPLRRLIHLHYSSRPRLATAGAGLTIALAATCVLNAVLIYPNYFPFVNALGMGRPAYELMNDSNVDWNQSLPEVAAFARRHGIRKLLLDEYGFSDPAIYIGDAQPWDCQQPAPADAGNWAVISSNFIHDGGNCAWVLRYPHETLAGGSMLAVHLPVVVPAAGQPGGPPTRETFRFIGGAPFDILPIFRVCIRDPRQLQPTMDRFVAMAQEQANKK